MDEGTDKIAPRERSGLFKAALVLAKLSTLISFPLLILLLLMSGLIIFVPVVAFCIWLFKQVSQKKLRAKWKMAVGLLVVALALSGALLWVMFHSTRRPDRYLIPQGYVGWVIVEYKVKGAPTLPREDGHNLIVIPRDGRLQTSSLTEDGTARDEFFYSGPKGRQELKDTGWGEGGMVWGGSISDGIVSTSNNKGHRIVYTSPSQIFFIGTEKQFQKAGAEPHSKQMQKIIDETDNCCPKHGD